MRSLLSSRILRFQGRHLSGVSTAQDMGGCTQLMKCPMATSAAIELAYLQISLRQRLVNFATGSSPVKIILQRRSKKLSILLRNASLSLKSIPDTLRLKRRATHRRACLLREASSVCSAEDRATKPPTVQPSNSLVAPIADEAVHQRTLLSANVMVKNIAVNACWICLCARIQRTLQS